MKKYKWVASSNNGWEDGSTIKFNTKKEAYEDMRNAVFRKMCWNMDYEENLNDGCFVNYKVHFEQDRIIHESFRGIYTYQIVEEEEEKEYMVSADINVSVHDFVKAKSEDEACKKLREYIAKNGHYYVNNYDLIVNVEITDCVE